MRILVTGGSGFIGSNLVDALVQKEHEVVVFDNFSSGNMINLEKSKEKIKIISGDIREAVIVDKLIADVDLVFHLAASVGVNKILDSTLDAISVNIYGSEVVLKSATKHNKRIIIASTSEIYGKNTQQPLSEEHDRVIGSPQAIRWSYSDAKAIEEATAAVLHQTQGLQVTTVRFFNTVGPRQTGKYGMVIPRFVQSAIKQQPLKVYGDGKQTRVFCHIDDAIEALLLLSASSETIGEVYNLGGVGELSINELADKVVNLTKSKSKVEHLPYSEAYSFGYEDMQRRVPDISKIKKTINWVPKRDINEIIVDTASYFKNL